ncbi:hypothetical protein [Archangium sp.]|uniref:hypothetical protein n=1 Tax=Archangium sp. TaxID=1872627 RepID=UPI002D358762|nr:hypothetical protein [Archangium sp.]HYO54246.1 hypothetical protein [Archangium sp.]
MPSTSICRGATPREVSTRASSSAGSTLATAAADDDRERKTQYEVQEEHGSYQEFTVRDHSEGLPGLFWRNFFGTPFVRLFGQRLETLPSDCVKHLGDALVLVQPYEFPSQAGSPEADARERELVEMLGPECFYDHERHQKPTRRPVLEAETRPVRLKRGTRPDATSSGR